MSTAVYAIPREIERRARQSQGVSNAAIHQMVRRALDTRNVPRGILADVGCGSGQLHEFVANRFERYIGIDAVDYSDFPANAEFHFADLNASQLPLRNNTADVAVAVETIEHLENPRAFMRELVRIAKPGGIVVITTPNQLSWLSLMTLVAKHRFNAFQDVHYPAHLTALLEVDLRRIAAECNLEDVAIDFSNEGRLPFTPWNYPRFLGRLFPRRLSDNLLLIGRKARE